MRAEAMQEKHLGEFDSGKNSQSDTFTIHLRVGSNEQKQNRDDDVVAASKSGLSAHSRQSGPRLSRSQEL